MSVFVVWSLVVLIAASRVYLGVHFTSDVVGTLLLAIVFVAGSEVFIGALHRRRPASRFSCGQPAAPEDPTNHDAREADP